MRQSAAVPKNLRAGWMTADREEHFLRGPRQRKSASYIDRGNAYVVKGEYDRAIADYTEAIELDPDYTAYYNRGTTYLKKGELDRAISDYTNAIRLNLDHAEGVYLNAAPHISKKVTLTAPSPTTPTPSSSTLFVPTSTTIAATHTSPKTNSTALLPITPRRSGSIRMVMSNVVITLEDSGTGIDPKNIDRIFQPFFTTKSNGMGMGLSICRSIIEAHRGSLSAFPARPHGTAFRVTLPAG
jgi:tetratricopeptide (TPR) repeat protein